MKNINNILSVILLLFAGFFVAACDDEETVVVPDNWITVSTDPMTIGYEGGSLTCDYTLAKGLDASVVYIINHESWCLGYIKDSKIMIDVDLSENINGRTAKMSLVVKVLPTNASYQNLAFTLAEGSEAFVELSESGVVKGVAAGEAKINVAAVDESGVTDVITLNIIGNIRLNRDSWTVSTSITYKNGNNYVTDGTTGNPEHLFDNKTTTYLSLVKPGKSYGSDYTAAGINEPLYFVVDMGAEQTFNYFTWMHRSTNGYNYLRAWGISMYGSNDGKNFIEIKSDIDIPYENNTDEIVIAIPESTYRYVKVQFVKWSDLVTGSTSGGTLQVAEFGLGREL